MVSYLPINLHRIVFTLPIGTLVSSDFQNTHSKGININTSCVMLFKNFRSHVLRSSQHRIGEIVRQNGGQTEISDLNIAVVTIDKYVVTLDITMNDRIGFLAMEVFQSLEYFLGPMFEYFKSNFFHLLQMIFQTSSSNNLSDEDYFILRLILPNIYQTQDVLVIQGSQ